MPSILVRPATIADSAAAVAVIRASITELCTADHCNDPATLERWLRNKTIESFQQWLANSDTAIVVAERETEINGVGLLTRQGDLHLCYVRPGSQRRGIGRAMLSTLETLACHWGLDEIRIVSSVGARPDSK